MGVRIQLHGLVEIAAKWARLVELYRKFRGLKNAVREEEKDGRIAVQIRRLMVGYEAHYEYAANVRVCADMIALSTVAVTVTVAVTIIHDCAADQQQHNNGYELHHSV